MTQQKIINVETFLNSHRVSHYQWLSVFLCLGVVTIDGFDTTMPAFVAPVLKKTWSLSGPEIGKIFGAGLAGLTVGSFAIGPLADKIGRKTVVLTSLAAFGILSFASAFASSLHVLIVLRFLGGLGLGATNPSCYALVSEIFPDKKRSLTVSIVTSGISMGGAIAGGVAAFVIPHFGWQSAFIVGGAIPLIMIPPLFLLLPDSIRYLALNGKSDEKLKIILNKIAPEEDFIGAHFIIGERYLEGSPIKQLLGKGLVGGTLLLWLSMFVALIVIWFITYWLPSLVNNAGSSVETASLTTSVLLFGIVSGCFLNCYLMSKLRPTSCVSAFCVSTFVLLMALGRIPLGQTSYVVIVVLGLGISLGGMVSGMNSLATLFYPTANRASGLSWVSAIGKIGAVFGSMIGGYIIAARWTIASQCTAFALPMLLVALCVSFIFRYRSLQKFTRASETEGSQNLQ